MIALPYHHLWPIPRITPFRWLALLLKHLKHGADGHLLHGSAGHLVNDCGSPACACADAALTCSLCPDMTPTQFHVTFTGVVPCAGCVSCPAQGVSLRLSPGSSLDGTYLLTHNGSCAWTTFSPDVPCSATLFASTDCAGTSTPIAFAIQQVRISSTQFRLQVTDDSNTFLLFDAVVSVPRCCAGFTTGNGLTDCGCAGTGETIFTLATGGTATVTPC